MISIDTETTGLDLHHGVKPFIVTTCDEDGVNSTWVWDVDPLTRQPEIPDGDLEEIASHIEQADEWVLQNPKFDAQVLQTVDLWRWFHIDEVWACVKDTLLAGHLLASNQPHDLTTMALVYLGVNIKPMEDAIDQACTEARRIARSKYPDWRIAKAGLPEMPSAKEKVAKFDMWLPRAIAREENYADDHPWWNVAQEYADGDSAVTLPLYKRQKEIIEDRGMWEIYLERLKCLPVAYAMEQRGITLNKPRLQELTAEYTEVVRKCERICVNLSDGVLEELPDGVTNNLKDVVYNRLGLVSNKKTKKGNDSMDKDVLEHWMATLDEKSRGYHFVSNLRAYRQRTTALSYMRGYERFWKPIDDDWYTLHPSLNPTGTDTLRWSSSNPNEQNISKKEGFNLRYCFGPGPGREWWSCDAQNIELRLPAYESGERELIDLFERPNEPPYYGSTHLLNFSTVYDDLWAKELAAVGLENVGPHCKEKYASTWYQWCKNGGFAVQYGAVEREQGTADRAFHKAGAHARLKSRFAKLGKLNEACIAQAEALGYVTTMPDKNVCPERGYPLLCSRTRWGGILPTVPLNYRVQGSAMWWMGKAMARCFEYLQTLPDHHIAMQVHDELVFDFPKGDGPEPWRTNWPIIQEIRKLMALGGDDLGVPTPVSYEYHPVTWSDKAKINA